MNRSNWKAPVRPKRSGEREYRDWRHDWLRRKRKESELRRCERCVRLGRTPPLDFIDIDRYGKPKYRHGRLMLGHKEGRLVSPEMKMDDAGVEDQCARCNNEMSGNYNKDGKPQWTPRS